MPNNGLFLPQRKFPPSKKGSDLKHVLNFYTMSKEKEVVLLISSVGDDIFWSNPIKNQIENMFTLTDQSTLGPD